MADIADVEDAFCQAILNAVYPDGVAQDSATGSPVKIYRGWPNSTALNQDIADQSQTVTVTSEERGALNTTRHALQWKTVSYQTPGCTIIVSGQQCLVGGSPDLGDVLGFVIDGVAYSYAVPGATSPQALVSALVAVIPGAAGEGFTLSFPFATTLQARVSGKATSLLETRRQEQRIRIALWCSTPAARDALGQTIDVYLSTLDWLPLKDGTVARIVQDGTVERDDAVNANVYRRDFAFRAEYATTICQQSAEMLFGVGHLSDPGRFSHFGEAIAKPPVDLPRLGAIRFDAWYDPENPIDAQCADALSAAAYRDRLPGNASLANDVVTWPRATQATIDAEIDAACAAGLGFWAFDAYADDDTLSLALQLYLSSTARHRIGFSMLGQTSSWTDIATAGKRITRDVSLMSQAGYVTVCGDRPLYFLLDATAAQISGLGSGGVQAQIAQLRQLAIQSGVGDPYVVWLSGAALTSYDNISAAVSVGADAAGCYCCPVLDGDMQSYAALTQTTIEDWRQRAQRELPMVPTAMCGWDQRPLIERPQAFYPLAPGLTDKSFYAAGTAVEIGAHIADLAEFVAENASACAAQIGLIYAWNELAEGGWMMPTWTADGPDRERVETIGAGLSARASRLAGMSA